MYAFLDASLAKVLFPFFHVKQVSLNWNTYDPNWAPALANFVRTYVVFFPALGLFSTYPLLAITLANNSKCEHPKRAEIQGGESAHFIYRFEEYTCVTPLKEELDHQLAYHMTFGVPCGLFAPKQCPPSRLSKHLPLSGG